MLLYTDGLVERRGESLDDGWGRLLHIVEQRSRQTANTATDGGIEALCDAVLTALASHAGDDDIALVALRMH